MSVLYAESWMGMRELSESLAPRRKIKSNFLPFRPMLPSARARFTTKGMSTRVERAMPMPILKERSKKPRRVMIFKCCILLFLKTLHGHQHAHQAPNAVIVGLAGNAADG